MDPAASSIGRWWSSPPTTKPATFLGESSAHRQRPAYRCPSPSSWCSTAAMTAARHWPDSSALTCISWRSTRAMSGRPGRWGFPTRARSPNRERSTIRGSGRGVVGQVHVVGGAAMLLAYDSRVVTRDIGAGFSPDGPVLKAIREVADEMGWPRTWLNNQASSYVSRTPGEGSPVFDHPFLHVVAHPQSICWR